jgi:excisionase family DNA binding protein
VGGDLTLQEAADLLGVHYMTAYRYVRLGLLPAHKPAGTWRVHPQDLEEFRTIGTSPPGAIGAGSGATPRHRAPWAERLEHRLVAGDARGSWGVVEAALGAGTELDELYLDVLSPALTAIGDRWEAGELDVAIEHRASGIVMRILGRLGPRFVRRGRTRGAVVVGAPAGEHHSLPVAMLADLIRQGGWDVSDLGADVPAASFLHAAHHVEGLVAIGVSVTNPESLAAASEAIALLRSSAVAAVPLVIGGRAVTGAEHARSLGADGYAAGGRGFLELIESFALEAGASEAGGGDAGW